MIFLVSRQPQLFESDKYQMLSPEEALDKMGSWNRVQFDSEENGRDAHINKMLSAQFGNDATDTRIVVDCSTINIVLFKEILENKLIIMQNAKFDLQFLYNYGIIPMKVYDTMIVEQLLHLGYPTGQISYALNAIAKRRLGVDIDKTVRGEIIWRGLDESVIVYGAGDVTYLEKIMKSQIADLRKQDLIKAAFVETQFVPVIAYLEWCGIHLDQEKWKAKMENDLKLLKESEKKLNAFVVANPILTPKYTYVDSQGNLFSGFDTTPKVKINWASPAQVVAVAKALGFDTTIQDKKSGEDRDSVLEKVLKLQKGISDEFLALYFDYKEHDKTVSSFGQGHLNAINPKTDRIHTVFRQLGAASGRMSCGSTQGNEDLAKFKKLRPSECTMPNIQQLPHDEITRACFTAPKGYKWVSCDWSAAEARLAGDIYNDQAVKDIFLKGIDSHSMYAKIFFKEQLEGIDVNDVKKLRPDLRSLAKGPEFALNFGGGAQAIMQSIQCSKEEADAIIRNYEEGFKGTTEFARRGEAFVKANGYVLMCAATGHKMYWWDWEEWKKRQNSFTQEFWEEYRTIHKPANDEVAKMVRQHFKAGSKWGRMARNGPTQGTCAVMLKTAATNFFKWIVEKGYFGKVEISALVHDEINCIYPEELTQVPEVLKKFMEDAAALYCKSLPIPAEAAVNDYWEH